MKTVKVYQCGKLLWQGETERNDCRLYNANGGEIWLDHISFFGEGLSIMIYDTIQLISCGTKEVDKVED